MIVRSASAFSLRRFDSFQPGDVVKPPRGSFGIVVSVGANNPHRVLWLDTLTTSELEPDAPLFELHAANELFVQFNENQQSQAINATPGSISLAPGVAAFAVRFPVQQGLLEERLLQLGTWTVVPIAVMTNIARDVHSFFDWSLGTLDRNGEFVPLKNFQTRAPR
jgi:hypothetical protein